MTTSTRWALAVLLTLNCVLFVAIINLGAFASKGPRYTADDGARERHERIQADLALGARIDLLHNQLAERVSTDDL
jgi:hypothetical protein